MPISTGLISVISFSPIVKINADNNGCNCDGYPEPVGYDLPKCFCVFSPLAHIISPLVWIRAIKQLCYIVYVYFVAAVTFVRLYFSRIPRVAVLWRSKCLCRDFWIERNLGFPLAFRAQPCCVIWWFHRSPLSSEYFSSVLCHHPGCSA